MEDFWPVSSVSSGDRRQQLAEELLQCQGLSMKLCHVLQREETNVLESVVSEHLMGKVLESFTNTISILMRPKDDDNGGGDEISQIRASSCIKSEEESDGSCRTDISAVSDGRGRYKRRRSSETWSQITSALVDDGHAWRKYGQKMIHNTDFPRSYFRCTHKHDQGCQATKQVQKISDAPPMYKTMYENRHTCKSNLDQYLPQLLLGSSPIEDEDNSAVFISFNTSQVHMNVPKPKKQCTSNYPVPNSSSRMIHSPRQGAPSSVDGAKSFSAFDYLLSADPSTPSSTLDTDYGSAMSGLHGLEIDNMLLGSPFNFDAVW